MVMTNSVPFISSLRTGSVMTFSTSLGPLALIEKHDAHGVEVAHIAGHPRNDRGEPPLQLRERRGEGLDSPDIGFPFFLQFSCKLPSPG
jgi:hypothetical protein